MDTSPMNPDQAAAAPRKRRRRGRDFDGRLREARRLRELRAGYLAAMPAGPPTAAQGAQLQALALATLRLELIAADSAQGRAVDDATVVALANLQGRLFAALGLAAPPPEPAQPRLADAIAAAEAARRAALEAAGR